MIGLLIAAAIHSFVPPETLIEYGSGWTGMLLMLVVGIPMYVCATASTPLAAGFLLAGVSPGAVLVFLMALFADVMLMRPLGLWAMLTLLAAEFARSQRKPLREQMFVMEWVIFGFVFAIAVGASMMMLRLTFTPGPSIDLMLNHIISTVLLYPPVAGILHYVFRIRAPRDAARSDRLGRVA